MTPRSRVDSLLVGALNRVLNDKKAELIRLNESIATSEGSLTAIQAEIDRMREQARSVESDISEMESRVGTLKGSR